MQHLELPSATQAPALLGRYILTRDIVSALLGEPGAGRLKNTGQPAGLTALRGILSGRASNEGSPDMPDALDVGDCAPVSPLADGDTDQYRLALSGGVGTGELALKGYQLDPAAPSGFRHPVSEASDSGPATCGGATSGGVAAGGDGSKALLVPPVLFSHAVVEPAGAWYPEAMSRLGEADRELVLRVNLRNLSPLLAAGFLEYADTQFYRGVVALELLLDGVDEYELVCWLNDLAALRVISETTAKVYRGWLSVFLGRLSAGGGELVRNWVIPFSKSFYTHVFGFLDMQDSRLSLGEQEMHEPDVYVGSFSVSHLRQIDLFEGSPGGGSQGGVLPEGEGSVARATAGAAALYAEHSEEQHRKTAGRSVGEYSYISGSTWDVFRTELISKRSGDSGKPRYKYGEIAAALFQCSLWTGLRHAEWCDAVFHRDGFTDSGASGLTMSCPVLQVFSSKQDGRRTDNPLRDCRLLCLAGLPDSHIDVIEGTVAVWQSLCGELGRDVALLRIRKQLSRVWSRLVEQRRVKETDYHKSGHRHTGVSMHTARKTFATEVRRSLDYTRFELAAMLGHTTLVNQRYYARARKFLPRMHEYPLPTPWPGDSEAIKEWGEQVSHTLAGRDAVERLRRMVEGSQGGLSSAQDWDSTLRY